LIAVIAGWADSPVSLKSRKAPHTERSFRRIHQLTHGFALSGAFPFSREKLSQANEVH
jgi:hypothetical protein